ncbi:ArsR/SmtB family transcription factor [Propionicimonas paludicola]|uniref:ArsR/SmtB family transcription factor n=1 Tax=Propionicimonas paludicola TaxID=185243 RepID=UPI000BF666EA|nr:metalloregulator ArsR/SmtB family transcription factor [Propionicimonas paludicola]
MLESNAVEVSVPLLAAVADPIRWQLIAQLSDREERCVCQLTTEPQIPANLLSYHLKVLREAGLVVGNRRGRWIDYRLTPDALDRLHAALPVPGTRTCGCAVDPAPELLGVTQ